MKKKQCRISFAVGLIAAASLVASSQVLALPLGPGDAGGSSNSNANNDVEAEIEAFSGGKDLSLYYKDNVGGAEEGPFASSYQTTFSNAPLDPADALIEQTGVPVIQCPSCYLVVKGGGPASVAPFKYFFDISSWDGMEDIVLTGFWPNQGAISNVAIWGLVMNGDPDPDPEPGPGIPIPGTLLLLGMPMVGLAMWRRPRG